MASTPKWYGSGLLKVMQGSIDLDTDTVKVLLATSAYTPDQDADDFRNDVTEASGTGYSAGGSTVTVTLTKDNASNEIRVDWGDIALTGVTLAWRYAVFYKSRGGASSADELIGYVDYGAQSITAQDLNLTFADPLKITYS